MRMVRIGIFCGLLAVGLVSPALAQPPAAVTPPIAEANDEGGDHDLEKFARLRRQMAALEGPAPATAIAAYQKFYEARRKLQPDAAIAITSVIAQLYAQNLKQPGKALELYNWAAQKFKDEPLAAGLLVEKALLLVEMGRDAEAEEWLEPRWGELLPLGPAALLGRIDISRTREINWFFQAATAYLLEQGQAAQALQWAKLQLVLAPYDRASLQGAVQRLEKVWAAQDADWSRREAWVQFQNNPVGAANPLASVTLPASPPATVAEQVTAVRDVPGRGSQRITLQLMTGQWRAAMLEACRMAGGPESATGKQEVCRVFKAVDMDLGRATEFIRFLRKQTLQNPVDLFFVQHPLDPTAPETGPAPVIATATDIPETVRPALLTLPMTMAQLRAKKLTPQDAWDKGALSWDDLVYVLCTQGVLDGDEGRPVRRALSRLLLSNRANHSLDSAGLTPIAKERLLEFFSTNPEGPEAEAPIPLGMTTVDAHGSIGDQTSVATVSPPVRCCGRW